MILEEFNSKYKYQSDKEKFGFGEVWEIPKLQEDGFYYGDCESYCRFLKNKVDGFKDWEYYYCMVRGEGHCVLYKDGVVIDCREKRVLGLSEFVVRGEVTDLKKYSWFVVGSKIVVGKVLSWISLLRR